jgi:8-oxo-dGTP diphosphatase
MERGRGEVKNYMLIPEVIKNPTGEFLSNLEKEAVKDNRHIIVDCIIVDDQNQIFIQKRSPDRRLYPNMWEVPGGHVDEGEDLKLTVEREIKEETGMDVKSIRAYLGRSDWEVKPEWRKEGDNFQKRSFVFVLQAAGNLILEKGKVTESKFVGEAEFNRMVSENTEMDEYISDVIKESFKYLKSESTSL